MVDTLDEAVGDITEAFRTAGFTLRRSLSSSRHYADYIIKSSLNYDRGFHDSWWSYPAIGS